MVNVHSKLFSNELATKLIKSEQFYLKCKLRELVKQFKYRGDSVARVNQWPFSLFINTRPTFRAISCRATVAKKLSDVVGFQREE